MDWAGHTHGGYLMVALGIWVCCTSRVQRDAMISMEKSIQKHSLIACRHPLALAPRFLPLARVCVCPFGECGSTELPTSKSELDTASSGCYERLLSGSIDAVVLQTVGNALGGSISGR